jgi:hypothetical protein
MTSLLDMSIKAALYSGQDKTTVVAIDCGEKTVENLRGVLKNALNLVRLARFEIDKLFRIFINAMRETARSL